MIFPLGFIRVYTGESKTKSDNLSDHLDSVAADTQLFGGGRSRTKYHHIYQTRTGLTFFF